MPDGATGTAVATRRPTNFEIELANYEPQIVAALPAHIPVERFKRVLVTAINQNPDLARADRRSLFTACIQAAQDGLMPDGREAALVTFGGKITYLPMIHGIRKRMRNTGEVAFADAQVVYEHDAFHYRLGDDPIIEHTPTLQERGKPICAYAIVKLTNGEVIREVMSVADIEKARAVNRGANPAWKTWWDQMARKVVLKRAAKAAPTSSDLGALLGREDDAPQHAPAPLVEVPRPRRADFQQNGADRELDEMEERGELGNDAALTVMDGEVVDQSTGEVTEGTAEHREQSQPETARDKPAIDGAADVFWTGTLEVKPEPRGKTGDFYFGKWEQEIARRINEAATDAALDDLLKANARHLGTHKLKRASDAAEIAEAITNKRNSFAPAEG